MLEIQYDITQYSTAKRPLSIKSFTIRETTGRDEDLAALASKARGGTSSIVEELIKRSLTEVDGQAVNKEEGIPFQDWEKWNSATRSFVTQAFQALNGVAKEDLDFLSQGKP